MSEALKQLYDLNRKCETNYGRTIIEKLRKDNLDISFLADLCGIISDLIIEGGNVNNPPPENEKLKSVLLSQMFDHRLCPNCNTGFIPKDRTSEEVRELYGELFGKKTGK